VNTEKSPTPLILWIDGLPADLNPQLSIARVLAAKETLMKIMRAPRPSTVTPDMGFSQFTAEASRFFKDRKLTAVLGLERLRRVGKINLMVKSSTGSITQLVVGLERDLPANVKCKSNERVLLVCAQTLKLLNYGLSYGAWAVEVLTAYRSGSKAPDYHLAARYHRLYKAIYGDVYDRMYEDVRKAQHNAIGDLDAVTEESLVLEPGTASVTEAESA